MTELFKHQAEGVAELTLRDNPARGRVVPGCLWIADDPGAGKTRQVIAAAEALHRAGEVDHVLVLAPGAVRTVWCDPDFGQVSEYSEGPVEVQEYKSGRCRTWRRSSEAERPPTGDSGRAEGAQPDPDGEVHGTDRRPALAPLRWTVSNYEFVRRPDRMAPLMRAAGPRTMLVLDESLHVKSPTSATTRAVYKLRQRCGRVVLLNGSPEGDNPGDSYAQAKIMSPAVLGCEDWFHFRARYAVMGGYRALRRVQVCETCKADRASCRCGPATRLSWKKRLEPVEIVDWVNLDDLGRRLAPYVLRRTKRDFADLPPVLDPVTVTVPLSAETWRVYREMRADSVAWLRGARGNERSIAEQAGVRVMRLAQLCAGFLGGVDDGTGSDPQTREVGREKLDAFLEWYAARRAEDPKFKLVVWCRFRPEVTRTAAALAALTPVGVAQGGQGDDEREAALQLLDPKTAPDGPAALVANSRTGAKGRDMHAAHTGAYLSNDYSLVVRRQTVGRLDRLGQTSPVNLVDFVATGPDGQKTADHAIVRAVRKKEDVAAWTTRDLLLAALEEE